jgi:intermembrane space import and assembly protein 40
MIEEKRRQAAAATPPPPPPEPTKVVEEKPEESEKTEEPKPAETEGAPADAEENAYEPGSPEALQQEAAAQGAFDPETGEINWACPCLGGMADGPCGEEFKAAFSCFVYSKEEPKGMDCIEKFQYVFWPFKREDEGTNTRQTHAGLLPEVPRDLRLRVDRR